ncbi:hypothetical protein JHK86_016594 [Glycine max]|nr:hypothetical protein JHK86_016594 [Glycine max]
MGCVGLSACLNIGPKCNFWVLNTLLGNNICECIFEKVQPLLSKHVLIHLFWWR